MGMRIDPSVIFDTDRERPVTNTDWTATVPPIGNTTTAHPDRCRCAPCMAEAEYRDWQRRYYSNEGVN